MEKNEIGKLSNEMTYLRYLMNKGKVRDLFQKVTIPQYIALHMIEAESTSTVIYEGRTYLKDLADRMQLTIRQTSRLVSDLKERGLVEWSHDGVGSEGTYVTISENGQRFLEDQEEVLKVYYTRVIQKFGEQNLIELLQKMKQLETVMSSEIEEMEAGEGYDRSNEIED